MQKLFYNEFKKTLGVSDAINEYIEVLLRQFERSSYDEASFQELASEFGIRVNDVSPKDAIGKIREYYIVTVFQAFEFFLKQLNISSGLYPIAYKEATILPALVPPIISTFILFSSNALSTPA